MNKNMVFVLLATAGMVSACNIGVNQVLTDFYGYNMNIVGFDSPLQTNCSYSSWNIFDLSENMVVCDKESSEVQLFFAFQGSPNFYITTPQTNLESGITVNNQPVYDPHWGVSANCANTLSEATGNYSCTTTVTANNTESSTLYFTLMGGAGVVQFYKIIYQ